jgi:hypothetical protein
MPKINVVWPLADSKRATLIKPNLVGITRARLCCLNSNHRIDSVHETVEQPSE